MRKKILFFWLITIFQINMYAGSFEDITSKKVFSTCSEPSSYDYQTISDGLWSSPSTWLGGNIPSPNIGNSGKVLINHNVTNTENDFNPSSNSILTVKNGGVLTLKQVQMNNSNASIILINGTINVNNGDFQVNTSSSGVCATNSCIYLANGNFQFEISGTLMSFINSGINVRNGSVQSKANVSGSGIRIWVSGNLERNGGTWAGNSITNWYASGSISGFSGYPAESSSSYNPCPTCNAGYEAPLINTATNYSAINMAYSIPCGSATANLNGLTASNKPSPSSVSLTWHTASGATDLNRINPVTSVSGATIKLYASFYDSVNNCYSPTTEITVYAPICAVNDDYSPTPVTQGTAVVLPSIFTNDTYNGSSFTMPNSNIQFLYELWNTSYATINANGTVNVSSLIPAGTHNFYYKICDTDPDAVSGSNCSIATVTIKVNPSYCTKTGVSGTPNGYTAIGISTQRKQSNWPEMVPNGHIALQSKTTGFVITRVQNHEKIVSPKEGMLIYDIDAQCTKLYNGTAWKCIARTCNE